MNRIPAKVVESLLADARRANRGGATILWSIRSIGELSNDREDGGGPSKTVAATVLSDVRLRLAGQYSKCVDLERRLLGGGRVDDDGRRIVRAVNAPVDAAHARRVEHRRTAAGLAGDLAILHADTYRLTHELTTPPSSVVVDRFSRADRVAVLSVLKQIQARHASSVETLASATTSFRRSDLDEVDLAAVESATDSFLRARLLVQLLCDQYVASHRGTSAVVTCSLREAAEAAASEASHVCAQNAARAPEMVVTGGDDDATTTMVRPWTHHVLVEVLKNALFAATEAARDDDDAPPPVVDVRISEEDDRREVRVVDRGAGLPSDAAVARAFRFAETDAARRYDRADEQRSYAAPQTVPLRGLGVGLPLSRAMMRTFGGDLILENNQRVDDDADAVGCVATVRFPKDVEVPETSAV